MARTSIHFNKKFNKIRIQDNMNPKQIKLLLEEKLSKNLPSRIFLDRMRLLDEESRKTAAYNDPRYFPSYYFLGTILQPKSILQIGFKLGLISANFLHSCKTVEKFLGFQEKTENFYSPRLGKANVKDHYKGKLDIYVGNIHDVLLEKYDLAIIDEEVTYDKYKEYLDITWEKTNFDGFIVMDYVNKHKPAKEAYLDFCKGKNREPVVVTTRCGLGIINV
jgi:predicted O-methyltransferase YrrM